MKVSARSFGMMFARQGAVLEWERVSWFDSALCVGDSLFELEHYSVFDRQREVCAACPVRVECLEWVLSGEGLKPASERVAVAGGLSPRERADLVGASYY